MKQGKSVYMHTLDGKPAYYVPGDIVVYVGRRVSMAQLFQPDLRTIKRQWRDSENVRVAEGSWVSSSKHGYLVVNR